MKVHLIRPGAPATGNYRTADCGELDVPAGYTLSRDEFLHEMTKGSPRIAPTFLCGRCVRLMVTQLNRRRP